MTKIEIENIELAFNFKSAEKVEKRMLSDLPETTILTLLRYGTRKANDYVNSAFASEGNEKTREELIADFMEKVDSGEFDAPRDTTESDFKKFVFAILKAKGATAKSLKGLSLEKAIESIAKGLKKEPSAVEKALRAKFDAQQEALKKALEGLNI